jgi:hypothetical protein
MTASGRGSHPCQRRDRLTVAQCHDPEGSLIAHGASSWSLLMIRHAQVVNTTAQRGGRDSQPAVRTLTVKCRRRLSVIVLLPIVITVTMTMATSTATTATTITTTTAAATTTITTTTAAATTTTTTLTTSATSSVPITTLFPIMVAVTVVMLALNAATSTPSYHCSQIHSCVRSAAVRPASESV